MGWASDVVKSPSKSFFVVLTGFLLGVFVGAIIDRPLPDYPLFVGFIVCVGVAILVGSDTRQGVSADSLLSFAKASESRPAVTPTSKHKTRLIALIFAFFLLGLFRFSQSFFPADAFLVSDTLNREARITGVVSEEVIEKNQGQQVVIDEVRVVDEPALGKVMAWLPKYPKVNYGDEVAFRCELEKPESFDGFRYDKYLRSRGVLAVCWRPESVDIRASESASIMGSLLSFKRSILDQTEEVFSEPHSTFLAGLLFGGKGSLATDLRQDFIDTGTAHILAASGYNVSIFSRFFFLFLVAIFFRRKSALAIVAGAVGFYVLMSGLDPAVTRAGIMGLVVLFGRGIGRSGSVRNILALTAVAMLFLNPRLLLDDVGFQLSFLSTIGLVSLVPRIEHWFAFIPTTGGFREAITSTVAATGMSLPILVLQFGTVSTVSVLVNLLALPLVPYAMGFGAVAIATGFISSSLAAIVAAPAWTCLAIMLLIIRFFGALDFSLVTIPYNEFLAAIAAIFVIMIVFLLYKQKRTYLPSDSEIKRPLLASFSISVLLIVSVLFGQYDSFGTTLNFDNKLRIWFFDVGQGDAIFVETPEGEQILVDGGPGEAVLSKLGSVMPFWDRTIDMIVLTHPHADHTTGLIEVLERYQVDQIVLTGVNYHSKTYQAFLEHVEDESAKIITIDRPMDLSLGSVKIQAIWPKYSVENQNVKDINETSIVLKIVYADSSVLLTGDMYESQETELASLIGDIDVLKVPHQGSLTSSSVGFIDVIDPEIAVITVGENSYGHPAPVVVRRYLDHGSKLYRTDLDGDILLISDGTEPEVQARPLIF